MTDRTTFTSTEMLVLAGGPGYAKSNMGARFTAGRAGLFRGSHASGRRRIHSNLALKTPAQASLKFSHLGAGHLTSQLLPIVELELPADSLCNSGDADILLADCSAASFTESSTTILRFFL